MCGGEAGGVNINHLNDRIYVQRFMGNNKFSHVQSHAKLVAPTSLFKMNLTRSGG